MTGARSETDGLLTRVASSDVGAFREFYDRTSHLVFGTALRVIGDRGYSEEITQEVYLEVWRKAGGFDPAQGSSQAWLVTIAHRRSVDRVRSERARGEREGAFAQEAFQRPFDPVVEAAERTEDTGEVVDCMNSLSDAQRDALTLAYYGGHTYREVAEQLATPLPTIKTRIRDGIARLRRCLGSPSGAAS